MLSELRFGIEFECYYDDGRDRQSISEEVLDLGARSVSEDETISVGVSAVGIEIDLGIRPLTPEGLRESVDLVERLFDSGARVNSSCSSHVHFSRTQSRSLDNFWFLYWFHKKNGYEVFQQFSGVDQFDRIFASISRMRSTMTEVCEWVECQQPDQVAERIMRACYFLEGEKFNLIRMHPQGTVEWRGFRGLIRNDSRALARQSVYALIPAFGRAIENCINSRSLRISGMSINDLRNRLQSCRRKTLRHAHELISKIGCPKGYDGTVEKIGVLTLDWPGSIPVLNIVSEQKEAEIHLTSNRIIVHNATFDGIRLQPNTSSFDVSFSECTFNECIFEAGSIGLDREITIEDSAIRSSLFREMNDGQIQTSGLEFGNKIEDCRRLSCNNSGIESGIGTHYL